jgi:hypothetical protein
MTQHALSYISDEVKSYLPSGWSLVENAGRWDAKRATWTIRVLDVADQDWPLAVKAADADKLGRMPALKVAMDRIYREGLG